MPKSNLGAEVDPGVEVRQCENDRCGQFFVVKRSWQRFCKAGCRVAGFYQAQIKEAIRKAKSTNL